MKISSWNQYRVKAEIELSKDDLRRNLYHLIQQNPELLEYFELIKEKLAIKGLI